MLYYEIFKKIIRNNGIKASVITSANGLFDKCLIAAAKETGILLVRVDHGIIYNTGRHSDLIGFTKQAIMSDLACICSNNPGLKKVSTLSPVN